MAMVYLNGAFMAEEDAAISPRDRGFRFGDGVFETIPVYGGRPYQWDFHYQRLQNGLKTLYIVIPAEAGIQTNDNTNYRAITNKLIKQNNIGDGFIRIAVSRGVGSRGYRPLPGIAPTVFVETMPRGDVPDSTRLWLSDWRKPSPHSLPPYKLAAQGVTSTLALLEAEAQGCDEALLLSAEGYLCEAASANLFWIKRDTLYTPALSTGCLPGATRHALARLHGFEEVSNAPLAVLQHANAVFLTNSNHGVLPVTSLAPMGWQWLAAHGLIETLQAMYTLDCHSAEPVSRPASAESSSPPQSLKRSESGDSRA